MIQIHFKKYNPYFTVTFTRLYTPFCVPSFGIKLRKLKLFHGCRKTGIVISLSGNTKYIIAGKQFPTNILRKKQKNLPIIAI